MTIETIMSDKLKKLKNLIKKVSEKTGATIKIASEIATYNFLDTPFVTVNNLIGGIPRGRFTTVAGPEHTGKGAFCLQLIAYHQNKDPNFIALWTDAENAFDEQWATKLGVDLDRLILQKYNTKSDTMEQLLDNALAILKQSKSIDMWVIDSIGGLIPKNDVRDKKGDKSLEDTNMLNLQRKLGEFYRKANVIISPDSEEDYKGCAVVLIGQVYTVPDAHVPLEAVKGGNAVKHWAHLRLMFRRGPQSDWPEKMKVIGFDGNIRDIRPGWAGRIKVDKTRINSNESREVLLTFIHGRGFDSKSAVIAAAFGLNIFERSGPTYKSDILPDGKIVGKDNLISFLNSNEEAYNKLITLVNNAALQEHVASDVVVDTPDSLEVNEENLDE